MAVPSGRPSLGRIRNAAISHREPATLPQRVAGIGFTLKVQRAAPRERASPLLTHQPTSTFSVNRATSLPTTLRVADVTHRHSLETAVPARQSDAGGGHLELPVSPPATDIEPVSGAPLAVPAATPKTATASLSTADTGLSHPCSGRRDQVESGISPERMSSCPSPTHGSATSSCSYPHAHPRNIAHSRKIKRHNRYASQP